MAGRAHITARARLEEMRLAQALDVPTEQRTAPIPYDPSLCDELVALANIGFTLAETAGHWAVAEEELQEWQEAHPAFAAAVRRARTRAKACWQRWVREAMASKDNKFPAGAWSQAMRAMFPEYDKQQSVTVQLDLSKLVMIDLRTTGLLGEQGVIDAKPLPARGSADASDCQTVSTSPNRVSVAPPTPLSNPPAEATRRGKSQSPDPSHGSLTRLEQGAPSDDA